MTSQKAPKGYALEKIPETDQDLANLLKLDKHTTIEGNVAEIFTENRLVKPILGDKLSQFSWWFHSEKWGEYKASAVSQLDPDTWLQLPEHERQIGRAVRHAVAGFRIVTFRSGEFGAHEVSNGRIRKKVQLLKQHRMKTLSPEEERNLGRLEKAAKRLAEYGFLQAVGLQRLYANFFAPNFPMWDMDCIGVYRGQVIAFDYKHKYLDSKEEFGANGAISRLYHSLHSHGIPVVYITLDKPTKDPSLSAVDMLDTESPSWYVCNARIFAESESVIKNRNGTAYDGGTPGPSKGARLDQLKLVKTAREFQEFLDSCIDSGFR